MTQTHAIRTVEPQGEASESRPVVFLDVDGVLNDNGQPDNDDCFYPPGHEVGMRENYLVLSHVMLHRLALVVAAHNCRIVLSSSWRLNAIPRAALLAGLQAVGIDVSAQVHPTDTPDLIGMSDGVYPAGVRVDELQEWLKRHHNPPWIALDDAPVSCWWDSNPQRYPL